MGTPRTVPNADAYGRAFAAAGIGGPALLTLIFAMGTVIPSALLVLVILLRSG